jgi:hypothetical protein
VLEAASISVPDINADERGEDFVRCITELKEYKISHRRDPYHASKQKKRGLLQGRALLDVLQLDIFANVRGNNPFSSLSYV